MIKSNDQWFGVEFFPYAFKSRLTVWNKVPEASTDRPTLIAILGMNFLVKKKIKAHRNFKHLKEWLLKFSMTDRCSLSLWQCRCRQCHNAALAGDDMLGVALTYLWLRLISYIWPYRTTTTIHFKCSRRPILAQGPFPLGLHLPQFRTTWLLRWLWMFFHYRVVHLVHIGYK